MSFQNPVFIPGPTNIPESLRKACDMPTIDHRSPLFGHSASRARRRTKSSEKRQRRSLYLPLDRDRWLGDGFDQHPVSG